MPYWKEEPVRCLICRDELKEMVQRLGDEISRDYRDEVSVHDPLLLVGILKGAIVFMADLARSMSVPTAFDFMAVSSYGVSTTSSGVVRILYDLDTSIEGRHVIVVEDIVDTGLTLRYIRDHLASRNPQSLKVCALLDKPERREVPVRVDYCGRQIPDEFVVGYGLDVGERYRDLPHVAVVTESG
ncbi:MAG: hypoxanthine phosphoribosyltransferase [Bacillota bacterium]